MRWTIVRVTQDSQRYFVVFSCVSSLTRNIIYQYPSITITETVAITTWDCLWDLILIGPNDTREAIVFIAAWIQDHAGEPRLHHHWWFRKEKVFSSFNFIWNGLRHITSKNLLIREQNGLETYRTENISKRLKNDIHNYK